MADNELRPLVVVVSFLALFVLVATMIPSEFYAVGYEGKPLLIPEYFEGIDIQSFAETHNFTIVFSGNEFQTDFTIAGWNIWFITDKNYRITQTATYAEFWGFKWNYQFADWYLSSTGINYGNELSYDELNDLWDGTSGMIGFNAKVTGGRQVRVFFGWNTTLYSDPEDAIVNDAMEVLYAIGFDQVNTSMNAWSLIGAILTFSLPEVHPIINGIFAIPVWISIAYLVYVLILKAIPFVGG